MSYLLLSILILIALYVGLIISCLIMCEEIHAPTLIRWRVWNLPMAIVRYPFNILLSDNDTLSNRLRKIKSFLRIPSKLLAILVIVTEYEKHRINHTGHSTHTQHQPKMTWNMAASSIQKSPVYAKS